MQSPPNLPKRLIGGLRRRIFGTLTGVRTDQKVAALTFDDGPHPEDTPHMLELLERHGAKGTFFVIGERAAAHPDLIARIVSGGHAVANHTYSHIRMPEAPRRQRLDELRRTQQALGAQAVRMFRPPFGGQTLASRIDTMLLGYDVVAWNMHAEDWAGHDSATMLARLERQLRPGSIILLHDTMYRPRIAAAADRSPLRETLDIFLQKMSAEYRFVTVPELLRYGKPIRADWFRDAL